MGKKKKKLQKKKSEVNVKVQHSQVKYGFTKNKTILMLAGTVIITLVLYIPSLFNGFIVNWDDGGYIHLHDLIHKLSFENFLTIFNPTTFYKGNYHPLTTFFYAIEYAIVGEKAFLYHFNNLIFHLLNVILVFKFIQLITNKPNVAIFTALLFGIHPMHVESVAWISERKDVLYTFFFLLASISYFNYLTKSNNKTKNYLLGLLYFLLSLFSKSAATILPLVLLLIDYLQKRKLSLKLVLDKLPFFALSLLFGLLAVFSQSEKGAIQDLTPLFSATERFFLVSNNIVTYTWKLFVPIDLSVMYSYPARINGNLPVGFYISSVLVLIFVVLIYISKKYGRIFIFGSLYFFVTIVLVLQILPVGGALLSERYTYVPYIGYFMMLGVLYNNALTSSGKIIIRIKPLFHVIVTGFIIMCFLLSWQRIQKWENGEVLFTDLIKKNPTLPFGYNNRGYLYYKWLENNEKANNDFSMAIKLDSSYYQAWSNRGVLYFNTGKYNEAIFDFTKALHNNPLDDGSLIGRANSYSTVGKFDEALVDYNAYMNIITDNPKAYLWRGTALYKLEKYEDAMTDFSKAEKMTPEDGEIYYWQGLIYNQKQETSKAIELFNKSISLNPDNPQVYSWRGIACYNLKKYNEAISDFTKAVNMNPNDAASFVNRAMAYHEIGKNNEAFADLNTAGQMGYPLNKEFFLKVMSLAGEQKKN